MAAHHRRSTKLVTWNANGLKGKAIELQHFLKHNSIDIALIQETHLLPSDKCQFLGYKVYRSDRPGVTRAGGTAIIIKHQIPHHQIPSPLLKSLEYTSIQIQTIHGPLIVSSAYSPPRTCYSESDMNNLLTTKYTNVIAGDLNAKHCSWNSKTTNQRGRMLHQHSIKNTFIVAGPNEATHISPCSKMKEDVLDIAIIDNIKCSFHLETIAELSSDHYPVILELGDEWEDTIEPPRYNLRKANWDKFREKLDINLTHMPDPKSTTQLDEMVTTFKEAIQLSIDQSIPKSTSKPCNMFDLPPGLAKAVKMKNQLRKQFQRNRTDALKTQLNKTIKQLKLDLTNYRRNLWNSKVASLNTKDQSIWKMAKTLQKTKTSDPPIQGPQYLALSPSDKANLIADEFEKSFTTNPGNKFSQTIEQLVKAYL
jgi:exonuclease III